MLHIILSHEAYNRRCKSLSVSRFTPPYLLSSKSASYASTHNTSKSFLTSGLLVVCLLALSAVALSGCYSQAPVGESALTPFYEESLGLKATSLDSVCSFAQKFYYFTRDVDFTSDPLYQPIVTNINESKQHFTTSPTFIFDTEWDGVIDYEF